MAASKPLPPLVYRYNFTGLRVALDPLPAMEAAKPGAMFAGKLEGVAGKDRSQYANFIADRYTNVRFLGHTS